MTKYRAVVFDLDGTLTDSAPGVTRCIRYALEESGFPVPEERELRKFLGPPLVPSFMQHCGMDEQQAVDATEAYRKRYHRIGWRENRVFPGLRQLLRQLKDAGCYVAMATLKPQDATDKILKYYGLEQYMDCVVGPAPNSHHATKTDILRKALGGHAGPAVMIGDRASDIFAAQELGIDSIAALFGYGSEKEMTGCGATHLAERVSDLFTLLGMREVPESGYFISFEGNDGCGKSTQVAMLHQFLSDAGFPCVQTREPGGTMVGEKVRDLLLDRRHTSMRSMTEAMLYAAARAQHVREVIQPALNEGSVLVCDRYVDSSVAYQGAGRKLGMELVASINAPAIDNTWPDLTILLEIDEQAALSRRKEATEADRLEAMDAAFHARVAEGFQELAFQNPQRIVKVDAMGTPDEVAQRVRQLVLKALRKAGIS